jgi:peptide/nickel transport system ATP-binding protein
MADTPLLSIRDLSIAFQTEAGLVPGVEHIDLQVRRGEIVGLVGESGSGKSITSLSILQLLPVPPARVLSGEILFTGRDGKTVDLLKLGPAPLQKIRGAGIAMIFQEPMTSLNPVYTCGEQVTEAIRAHRKIMAGKDLFAVSPSTQRGAEAAGHDRYGDEWWTVAADL